MALLGFEDLIVVRTGKTTLVLHREKTEQSEETTRTDSAGRPLLRPGRGRAGQPLVEEDVLLYKDIPVEAGFSPAGAAESRTASDGEQAEGHLLRSTW